MTREDKMHTAAVYFSPIRCGLCQTDKNSAVYSGNKGTVYCMVVFISWSIIFSRARKTKFPRGGYPSHLNIANADGSRRSSFSSYSDVRLYYHSHNTIDCVLNNKKASAVYISCLWSLLRNNFSRLYYDTEVSRSPRYSVSSFVEWGSSTLRRCIRHWLIGFRYYLWWVLYAVNSYCTLADASVTNSFFSLLKTDFQMQPWWMMSLFL